MTKSGRGARAGHRALRRRFRRRHAARRRPLHRRDRACSATTSRRCRTSRPRSARRPARSPASRPSRSTSPSRDILTPGDTPNVLVAMNPAALKANIAELERGATIIVNEDAFTKRNLEKAGYEANPLEDGSLSEFRVHRIPMTTLTSARSRASRTSRRATRGRAKNLFALGLLSWLYGRPTDVTERWIEQKFAEQAGRARGEPRRVPRRLVVRRDDRADRRPVPRRRRATDVAPGTYRNVNGTTATGARADRGERPQRAAAGARLLPDHAGLGAPARARAPRRARRAHDPGRGRDRRRRDGARRRVRRARSASPRRAVRAWT